jgi:hypothetical protein
MVVTRKGAKEQSLEGSITVAGWGAVPLYVLSGFVAVEWVGVLS